MVSRNPKDYTPTTHAKQMRRDRNIDWCDVTETIKTGKLRQSDAQVPHQREFVQSFRWYDYPLGVLVDIDTNEIITVEFRY